MVQKQYCCMQNISKFSKEPKNIFSVCKNLNDHNPIYTSYMLYNLYMFIKVYVMTHI